MFYNASLSIYQYWINILLCSTEVKKYGFNSDKYNMEPQRYGNFRKAENQIFVILKWMGKMYFWSGKLYLTPWI